MIFLLSRVDHSKFISLLTYLTYMTPDVNKQTTGNSGGANVFIFWNSAEPEMFFGSLLHLWQLQPILLTFLSINSQLRSELFDCLVFAT